MIDVGFSVILGFAIASILYGVLQNLHDDRMVARFAILLLVYGTVIGLGGGEIDGVFLTAHLMIVSSFMEHVVWLLAGATTALITQLITERHLHNLWFRIHP